MFEKNEPILPAQFALSARPTPEDVTAKMVASSAGKSGTSAAIPVSTEEGELRVMEWSELTARLSAARDLRRVLQQEVHRQSDNFADAAQRYFRAKDNNEQGVNLVVLEQGKGSSCIEAQRKLSPAAQTTRETE